MKLRKDPAIEVVLNCSNCWTQLITCDREKEFQFIPNIKQLNSMDCPICGKRMYS